MTYEQTSADHLKKAEEYNMQAKAQAEKNNDCNLAGQLILKALREERLAKSTGPQVMEVIKKSWTRS